MDPFHVYFDTSLLHSTPFGHPHFERLLHRVQQGVARLYVPLIALEERRTQLLDDFDQRVAAAASKLNELKRGQLSMILGSLPEVQLIAPTREDADGESIAVLKKYLEDHKIEVLHFTSEHGEKAWRRYFGTLPPFNPDEKRENRRKDIPDAWILEAVLGNMDKQGRHCVLTKDNRLEKTLEEAGAEVWNDIGALEASISSSSRLRCWALKRSDCAANFMRLSSAFSWMSLALIAWLWRSSVSRRVVISRNCSALRSSRDCGCINMADSVPRKALLCHAQIHGLHTSFRPR